jgi:hypothetical protein
MSQRVTAIASVYDNLEIIPHWLDHYSRLGVNHIVLSVRSRDLLQQAEVFALPFPIAAVHYAPASFFEDSDKAGIEMNLLNECCPDPDEYVMHLDLDEFQEYPAPLPEIIDLMNEAHDWALRGWIVDRVTADGKLAPIRPEPTIFDQFPICCDISECVLGAWSQKIMLCRRRVRLRGGVRHDTENAYYDRVPIQGQYIVHHFKWIAGLPSRLEKRLGEAGTSNKYKHECRLFLEHYQANGDRIGLADPRVQPRFEGPFQYPRI